MKVRVFASLRDVAGGPWIDASGSTVREVLDDAARTYGERLARQLPHCKVVLNGDEVTDLDAVVTDADELALLPPVAGG